jgi:hypothetical protein
MKYHVFDHPTSIKFSDLPELHQRIVRDRFPDESSTSPATDTTSI